jgi:thiol-disulfide isomerase/thioredoxin
MVLYPTMATTVCCLGIGAEDSELTRTFLCQTIETDTYALISSNLKEHSVFPLSQPSATMRFSSILSPASVVALASLILADAASDVLSLTASTFQSSVNTEPLILVEFFAPWYEPSIRISFFDHENLWRTRCGHCKALAPHYEEAATTLKEKNIKIAKVDCVDEADLCQSHGIQGYP